MFGDDDNDENICGLSPLLGNCVIDDDDDDDNRDGC